MSADAELSPMMAQYRRIKEELPRDALLLFRLGDFYELFFDDAREGAPLLNVALTQRQGVPMCGIPYHAANNYIGRLLKAGRKVAICDQTEEARPGKLVRREVTAILSPGSHLDERLLSPERNNFLVAAASVGSLFGIAAIDLSTGDFQAAETKDERGLFSELERLRPAELIHPADAKALASQLVVLGVPLNPHETWAFAPETAEFTLKDHFKVASLDGFGLRGHRAAVAAAGAALHYLGVHLRRDLSHLTRLRVYAVGDFLALDAATLRTLEVVEPQRPDGERTATLFGAVNRTATPMGARRLRHWLTQPLARLEPILARQEAIQRWIEHPEILEAFRAKLLAVRDLERTLARLSLGSGNARDLTALRDTLRQTPALIETVTAAAQPVESTIREFDLGNSRQEGGAGAHPSHLLSTLAAEISTAPDLTDQLTRALVDAPPPATREGGMIRDGFDNGLDELRAAARDGKEWLARLQQDESARTGIGSLKIGFNSVFGYYLEVSKPNLSKVPPDYIRKQTVANGERYITPQLKEMEARILGAEERSVRLEHDLFLRLTESVLGRLAELQATAGALASLDALGALAEAARFGGWVRPDVRDEGVICIRDGRHPVLERSSGEDRFVPNDLDLNPAVAQVAIITGPNMAGKSTYIRQCALLTLLAHAGSFVPAASARLDLADRIFTRIGASDDLARGQSTFMVEMSETASILNNATRRSLVILDEVGRGTSTFDGLSLAWSIVEHLHHQVGAKTLFATHYHELTELAGRLPRVVNWHVAVREWNDQIVFLRKVRPGGSDKSYGIQVARLAGVPPAVVERAKVILRALEEVEMNLGHAVDTGGSTSAETEPAPTSARSRAERRRLRAVEPSPQLDLFRDFARG